MLRATLKNLLARKVRLVLSGMAVVLGVMFVSGAFVLTDTLGRSFDSLFAGIFADTDVQVSAHPRVEVSESDGEEVPGVLPASLVDQVAAVDGVARATGRVAADGARVIGRDGKVISSFGPPRLGINWTGESGELELREGRGPQADGEIAMNAALAESAGVHVGDRVAVLTLAPKQTFTLVGIFGYSGGRDSLSGLQQVAFTTPVAQKLMLGEPDVYTSVKVTAADGVTDAALRDRLAARFGDTYKVQTGAQLAKENSDELRDGLSFFNKILLGFAGVALFVGTFLILNTFSIIIAQRTRELALMRAMGASRGQVIRSVLVEATAIGLIASLIGLGLGIGVGAGLASLFGSLADGLPGGGVVVPAVAVYSSFTVGLLVTLIAAVLPAVRAARIPPVAAMQDAATPDKPLTRLSIAGAVVLAAGGTLLGLGLTDNAGDAVLAAILGGVLVSFIGVALLTPLICRPVVGLLGRLFSWSVPGRLGRLNSGRNPRRTAITAAALMVGIALITGVGTILDSVTKSFEKLAGEEVAAELYIAGDPGSNRMPSFDPAVLTQAAALPGVADTVGIYSDQVLIDGKRDWVAAATDMGAVRRIFNARPVSGSMDNVGPDELIVDEETAADRGLVVGSTVTIQTARAPERVYTVAAVYSQTKLFSGFLLAPQAAAGFGIPQPNQGFVKLAPGATVAQVKPQLDRLLADSPEVSAMDRQGFVDQQRASLDSLLLMIQILLGLAILIAVLGIVNTLALSVLERTRELGLLRAIGLRRGQTMRMITVEAVVISVFGALLGVVVGAGLGAAVVRALHDEGITEYVFPWGQMGTYLVLAGVVGVFAAILPAIRAARTNVLTAIAYE